MCEHTAYMHEGGGNRLIFFVIVKDKKEGGAGWNVRRPYFLEESEH